jgi:hypothetical protein
MKLSTTVLLILIAPILIACKTIGKTASSQAANGQSVVKTEQVMLQPPGAGNSAANNAVAVQQVPFQIATSSVTVERMAQQAGCVGGKGASLVTEKGPVEVYRMQCDNGKVFLAKCELRQCSRMSW